MGPGREFDAIRDLVSRWGPRASGIGDDAAVLGLEHGEQVVVSTDTSVEDVHFRRGWLTPEEIGWRATMAGLSDLAAMGARPLGVVVALTVPESWRPDLGAIGDGIGGAAAAVDTPIVGGDLNAAPMLSLGVTAVGASRAPVRRAGATAGDELWVTGVLGGPGAALADLSAGTTPAAETRARFARPIARVAEGQWLAAHGARAAIDVSDGLVADARHVAEASGVSLTIELGLLPCIAGVTPIAAAASGEEYELLVALPRGFDATAFVETCGTMLTRIGEVVDGPRGEVLVTLAGARVEIVAGHDHFSR
jgi:thiamine-monophosphate kinase